MSGPVCPACGGPFGSCGCADGAHVVDPLRWRLLCAGVYLMVIVTALVIGPAVLG